jgi:hypothetical protein
MSLILHCGAKEVTYQELEAIPVPEATRSYAPMAHHHFIDMIQDSVSGIFGADAVTENAMGVTEDGARLFGVMTIALDSPEHTVALGYRGDHGKDLSRGVCTGARMLVCDNLCFSGSGVNLFRKHTTNIYRDMPFLIHQAVAEARSQYALITGAWDGMKAQPLALDAGYERIGLAQGQGVLTSRQAGVAFSEWDTPSHAEFEERNVFALHQAFTEAAKKGDPALMMKRYPAINHFFGIGQAA